MKLLLLALMALSATLSAATLFTGCQSTDSGNSVAGAAYYESDFHDPWYYGDYHDDADIIVTPPGDRPSAPPKPTHPIATPPGPRPTPMPSIPRMPMPVRAR